MLCYGLLWCETCQHPVSSVSRRSENIRSVCLSVLLSVCDAYLSGILSICFCLSVTLKLLFTRRSGLSSWLSLASYLCLPYCLSVYQPVCLHDGPTKSFCLTSVCLSCLRVCILCLRAFTDIIHLFTHLISLLMATFIFFLRPFFQIPMPVKFCTEATHDKLL